MRALSKLLQAELGAGILGLRLYIACVVVASLMMGAVWMLGDGLTKALNRGGTTLLGGDIAITTTNVQLDSGLAAELGELGTISRVAELRSSATAAGNRVAVELKGVDDLYPLYGEVKLDREGAFRSTLVSSENMPLALVESAFLSRTGASVGDIVSLAGRDFRIAGELRIEPDRLSAGRFMVGPRVMIRLDDLLSSELVQRGSIVEYRYRIAARDGMSGADLYQAVSALTPEAGWELERPSDAGDRVRRTVERTTTFLGMAAIVALSIGLAGSWAAGMAWIARRSRTISLYRLSGAMPGLIAALHGVIMLVAGLIGIVVGLGLAVMLAVPLMQVVSERLHLVWAHSAIIEPLFDVGLALVLGIAGSSLFALSGATRISPGAAMRSGEAEAAPDRLHALAGLLLVLAALLYATFSLPAPGIAIMVVAGLCIAVVILGMGGAGLARLATLLPATGFTGLVTQQGLSRRGSVAMRSVAIGIGIAGITAIVAAQSSLETALRSELPDRIPDLVLIDVQPDQVGPIRDRIESAPGLSGLQADPFMRMTITAVNDVPAAEALVREDKSWVIEGDRSFSWTAEPTGAELLAGEWWAADYAGPPLLSPEEDLMEAFDLKPGDRLTYSVLGRSFTSEVANIRKEYHRTFRPEYLLVASPEPFRNAPQAWIMSLQGDGSGAVDQLVRDLAGDHPNVTAIDIRQLVTQVAEMIEGGVMASLAVAFTLVLAGGLSLAAVIASDVDARRREALVFSVVGASRTEVAVARLVEALAVGLIAALLGGATGLAGGYWAVEQALRVEWAPGLQSYLLPLLLGLLASASAGLAGGLGAIPRGRGQLARLLTS